MPVKTLAMRKLKNKARTFYVDEHGDYSHEYVDFYPASLVEEIITDLSNQVLDERKKWNSLFEQYKAMRKKLRKERYDAIHASTPTIDETEVKDNE